MSEPDSLVSSYMTITVEDTPENENPAYGSVRLIFQNSQHVSTSVRTSLDGAKSLRDALTQYIENRERA